MERKATHQECIEYLNKQLAFRVVREFSDSEIHATLGVCHLVHAQSLRQDRRLNDAFDHVEKALVHIRQSYIVSHESGEECGLEKFLPEECWSFLYTCRSGKGLQRRCQQRNDY